MHTKTVTVSYALIGAAVAASFIFNKMLERDIKRHTEKMHKDMETLKADVSNLVK